MAPSLPTSRYVRTYGTDPARVTVDDDPSRLDLPLVHSFLTASYWARGIPRATLDRAIAGSLVLGVYAAGEQVAFARVVTDRATFAYLCDVFTAPGHERKGYARMLMTAVTEHPDLQGLRRMVLATRDAHALYARFGFTPLGAPDRFMERLDAEVYSRG